MSDPALQCRPAHAEKEALERPLPQPSRVRNDCDRLAQALLYAEQDVGAHAQVLRDAFFPSPHPAQVLTAARETLDWTAKRPPPRLAVLRERLASHASIRKWVKKRAFGLALTAGLPRMRVWPGTEAVPCLETASALAAWLRLDAGYLSWMADLSDRNREADTAALTHYHAQIHSKRDGGLRLVEAPKQLLRSVQRQILHGLLDQVEMHDAVHGFRRGRSIVSFAAPHAGQAVVLRLDLKDFFVSISGARVQAMFRTLGYPEHVADLLGGLCTTTAPDAVWVPCNDVSSSVMQALKTLYRRPHLPQGAPTSPAIANVCARRLDLRLAGLAQASGARYTRYADDLAFSGDDAFVRRASRFAVHVSAIVAEEGFAVCERKTRIMRQSGRQKLAGLVVNQQLTLPRTEWKQIEAILFNCVQRGPAEQNREGHPDFRAHLEGRVAFAAMVDVRRAERLRTLLRKIVWP